MTIAETVIRARLKEMAALSRLRQVIAATAFDADWSYCLAALDDRLHHLRELLAREDAELIRRCEEEERDPPALSADDAFLRSLHIAPRVH